MSEYPDWLIERVARAIYEAERIKFGPWERVTESAKNEYRIAASRVVVTLEFHPTNRAEDWPLWQSLAHRDYESLDDAIERSRDRLGFN